MPDAEEGTVDFRKFELAPLFTAIKNSYTNRPTFGTVFDIRGLLFGAVLRPLTLSRIAAADRRGGGESGVADLSISHTLSSFSNRLPPSCFDRALSPACPGA